MDRRNFISQAANASLAATLIPLSSQASAQASSKKLIPSAKLPDPIKLPPQLEDQNETMPVKHNDDQRIGIALVGLGRLSIEEILPAFAESKRTRVTGLVSGDRKKAERLASMYDVPFDSIYSYENFDEIKNNPDIHAVYIVLPNSLHAEFTIRAAKAHKHVLCEKPMAMNVRECEEMIKACKEAGKKLMIAYRVQYYPHHLKAKDMIEKGKLGKLKLLDLQNPQNQSKKNADQWRHKLSLSGGGALVNVGIYCLNAARFLTGEEPIEIFAYEATEKSDPRFKETEDSMTWTMKFPSGVIAHCLTSHGTAGSQRYTVMGTDAVLEMNPAFSYEGVKMMVKKKDKDLEAEVVESLNLPASNQFARELDHLAFCILNDKTPYTPGEEGLQDHKIMAAIYESAKSGKPVKLEMIKTKDVFRGERPQ